MNTASAPSPAALAVASGHVADPDYVLVDGAPEFWCWSCDESHSAAVFTRGEVAAARAFDERLYVGDGCSRRSRLTWPVMVGDVEVGIVIEHGLFYRSMLRSGVIVATGEWAAVVAALAAPALAA